MTERKSITCKDFIEALDDFVAEEMTPDAKSAAVAHLGECRSCVSYDESYRRTIALERSLTEGDRGTKVPAELAAEIERNRRS
jgi:anti-sigma factor RsiW